MDKLAPWSKGIARVLLAGLLAWTLVMQGAAGAALFRAVAVSIASGDFDRCAAADRADEHRHSQGPHVACSCCIASRSGHLDELTGFLSDLPKDAGLSFPAPEVFLAGALPIVEAASPPGWISSWSSRAPPMG
ncbi:hypothetical protein [Methylosinus sporium]|uniref:hypothetical protein n=1 Tax=Methylosinus sporium TaxID=428 RepID=UPI00383BE037